MDTPPERPDNPKPRPGNTAPRPDNPPLRPVNTRPIPPLRPQPARPKRDYAAEEETARRLTAAQIELRRGRLAEAEAAVRALLADRPTDAGAWELLGDIEETRGQWDAALEAYKTAGTHAPGGTAEAKLGTLVLRRAERQRQETLGVTYAAADAQLMRRTGGERSGWMVVLGSAICPGLGQIVQGQTIKGGVMVGVFVLGVVLLTLVHGTGHAYFTPAFWVVSLLLAADWLYAVADASAASRP